MQGMLLRYETLRPDLPLRLYICTTHAAEAAEMAAMHIHTRLQLDRRQQQTGLLLDRTLLTRGQS